MGSLELNSMTTGANGGLNSSKEREGQQMVPAHGRWLFIYFFIVDVVIFFISLNMWNLIKII